MKATKEILEEATRLYNTAGELTKQESYMEDEYQSVCDAYNHLIEEYDFSYEIFRNEAGKEGLKLCTGTEVLAARYDKILYYTAFPIPFDNLLVIASIKDRFYLINHSGDVILESDEILPCCWGLGPVVFRKGRKWGMASSCGKIMIEARYDKVYPDVNGFIFLQNEGMHGFIIPDWSSYIEPTYDSLEIDSDEYLIGSCKGKMGYVNYDGNITEDITDDVINIDSWVD